MWHTLAYLVLGGLGLLAYTSKSSHIFLGLLSRSRIFNGFNLRMDGVMLTGGFSCGCFWSGRRLSLLDLLEAGSIPGPNICVPSILDFSHHFLGVRVSDAVDEIK